jgi:hypothetical protein
VTPRHAPVRPRAAVTSKTFDYDRDYERLDLRQHPELYRIGRGEQGVLLVQPYKSEILPLWRFRTPAIAEASASAITALFFEYKTHGDFVGMDMARKFLQMGFTRARRYANRASGRKYDASGELLPLAPDPVKAAAAAIFRQAWDHVEADEHYIAQRAAHKARFG